MSFDDFFAKFFAYLLLNFLIRVIEKFWEHSAADEVIFALLERSRREGVWSAVWSGLASIRSLCRPPGLSVQIYFASASTTNIIAAIVCLPIFVYNNGFGYGLTGGIITGACWAVASLAGGLFNGAITLPYIILAVLRPKFFKWFAASLLVFTASITVSVTVIFLTLHATVSKAEPHFVVFLLGNFVTTMLLTSATSKVRISLTKVGANWADAACARVAPQLFVD